MRASKVFPTFFFWMMSLFCYSQNLPVEGLNSIIRSTDTLLSRLPIEKAYIQLDKPYYTPGDTMWLKAYLFDAAYLTAPESGLLYIELVNDTNEVVRRQMLPMYRGMGHGDIPLIKEDIPEGSYTFRAYTNLMRNFGEDYVFKKNFYISSVSDQNWLVKSDSRLDKQQISLALQFSKPDKQNISLREMQLRVLGDKKTLFQDKVQTDIDGKLDINFNLPEKADASNITVIAGDGTRMINIPLTINRPGNIDLQFMPEGGYLVSGISNKVGFKAIAEDGKGIDVIGKVYSSSGEVAAFTSFHKGMGSFEFTSHAGEVYTAKILLADGTIKNYSLPQVKDSGTVLRITNEIESDSIEIVISGAAQPPAVTAIYYLIGQSRGVICYAAIIRINNNVSDLRKIPKELFPTGIAKFSLLNNRKEALNERITFIDRGDNLKINITADKEVYSTRDSIALNIRVTDKDNHPIRGSFSLAVTDDSQVNADSTGNNLLTSILLTSDLKGTVEEPAYYLNELKDTNKQKERWRDLDNLLLTHGWVGYDWNKVFTPAIPEYNAEKEFIIKGSVSNILNKGVEGSGVVLFSFRPLYFLNTSTNADGNFLFNNLPPIDTAKYIIQARNKRERSFNIGIEIEEFKPQVFKTSGSRFTPWYLNSDTGLLKLINTRIALKQEETKLMGGSNVLQEVVITGKKVIKGSKNLNGPGEADQILDEKDMAKAPKTTLLELLEQKVPGFNVGLFSIPIDINAVRPPPSAPPPIKRNSYRIYQKEIRLIVDGIDVDRFYQAPDTTPIMGVKPEYPLNDRYEYIKDYLEFIKAEDIKGIEVMYNQAYNSKYNFDFSGNEQLAQGTDLAYLEITTYSGNGAFMKKTPGVYLYKPMPFVQVREFYQPKYTTATASSGLSDTRATLHWAPNVITDKEGKASVSFYSSDKKGPYTLIAEGADMQGHIGAVRKTLIVK